MQKALLGYIENNIEIIHKSFDILPLKFTARVYGKLHQIFIFVFKKNGKIIQYYFPYTRNGSKSGKNALQIGSFDPEKLHIPNRHQK